jgi:hypothetical protein
MQRRMREREGAAAETEPWKLKMAHDDAESTDAVILTSDGPYVEKLFLLIYVVSKVLFWCCVAVVLFYSVISIIGSRLGLLK